MPEVSGYSMELYCDHGVLDYESSKEHGHVYNEFPHEFYGETREECARKARKKGWVFHRNNSVSCPKCKNKGVPKET